MASDDYGQITTILQRLGEALSMLNPLKVGAVIAQVAREIGTPPPGDAAALHALAQAFGAAASAVEPVQADVSSLGYQRLPEAWDGLAATSAAQVIDAAATAIGVTPGAFRDAARGLDELANRVAEQQRRHGELHQRLYDAAHDATHVAGLPIPDPTALDDLVAAAAALIRDCIDVYTDAMSAADTAAATFADVAGQARTAAGVSGGLDPADAVVLAAHDVEIPRKGNGYDDGVLTTAQLARAGEQLAALPAGDRAAVHDLLARAGSDTERAYLLKAVAAGHSAAELASFANRIRGEDSTWLHRHLTLIDRGGPGEQERLGALVDQFDNTTCGTTSLIVARAEADPLYALSLTDGDPATFDERLSAEQRRVHDQTNTFWPEALGTSPQGMTDYLNDHAGASGVSYDWHLVDDTDQREVSTALREVTAAVDAGHPVPILVGDGYPAHYVLAVGHEDGKLLIYDPGRGTGATVEVPAADFLGGRMDAHTGYDHVQAVIVPQH